jgi:hypothetical protein
MRILLDTAIRRLMATTNILTILAVGPGAVLVPRPLAAQQGEQEPPKLNPGQLDDVVARVALYPDPLLAQVMAAATFPEQIPAATQWANQHRNLKGDTLAQAMENTQLSFDPSVQALIAFPSVLDLLNNDLAWTQTLGDATLVQRGDVMDAVQRMRRKAYDVGNLKSSTQIIVTQPSPQVIEIQPPAPTVIYVPVYNPQVVYVYPPPPPAGAVVAAAVIGFAVAVALTPSYCNSYWGYHAGFGWSSRTIVVYNGAWGRTWVNHRTYIHTWGGVNRGFYAKPYAYVNNNMYVRRGNVNVNNMNINRNNVNINNANINRNNLNINNNNLNRNNINANTANVNRNNVNPNNPNLNRNANVNPNVNRGSLQTQRTSPYASPRNPSADNARGYAKQSPAPSGALTGVQNGRSEQAAAVRGKISRGK